MKMLLLWLIHRLQERRTYIGLAWLLTVGGVSLRPDLWDQITIVGMALAGLLEVVFKEPRYVPSPASTDPTDCAEPERMRQSMPAPDQSRRADADSPGFNDR